MPVKIIAGGYAVGRTTFVGSIGEIEPLTTEASLTSHSHGVDVGGEGGKSSPPWRWTSDASASATTSSCTCSGHPSRTVSSSCGTTLFAEPSAPWSLSTRAAPKTASRPSTTSSRPESPFVVAVQRVFGRVHHTLDDIREALAVPADTPMMITDARDRAATSDAPCARPARLDPGIGPHTGLTVQNPGSSGTMTDRTWSAARSSTVRTPSTWYESNCWGQMKSGGCRSSVCSSMISRLHNPKTAAARTGAIRSRSREPEACGDCAANH